eukprot:SAG11_NODE_3327_length_2521_cov_20.966969_2_plen_156_part_00
MARHTVFHWQNPAMRAASAQPPPLAPHSCSAAAASTPSRRHTGAASCRQPPDSRPQRSYEELVATAAESFPIQTARALSHAHPAAAAQAAAHAPPTEEWLYSPPKAPPRWAEQARAHQERSMRGGSSGRTDPHQLDVARSAAALVSAARRQQTEE